MKLYKFFSRIFKAKVTKKDSDFSLFVSAVPPTRKQLLIEECEKHDVSIYIDDPSEQSAGIYAIFRGVVSEAELERRLNPKRAISLTIHTNVIALFALIVSALVLAKSFL